MYQDSAFDRVLDSYYQNQVISGSGGSNFYKGQIFSTGHGLNSILSSVFKFAKPLLKKTGRYVAQKGVQSLAGLAEDIIKGDSPKQALKRRSGLVFESLKKDFRNKINRAITQQPAAVQNTRKKQSRKQVKKIKKRNKDNLGFF
ncbi:MAG: hypothetical protein HRT42_06860 [Campylobacteraceae bacterium]|nr:hypothetical protein [Campylobacteraceae bacterium]